MSHSCHTAVQLRQAGRWRKRTAVRLQPQSAGIDSVNMERSCLVTGKKTTLYYAHRILLHGDGEAMKMAMASYGYLFPKLAMVLQHERTLREIQDWMNNLARLIPG